MKNINTELNKYFVDIYGSKLEQLDKEDLIKMIAIYHNINMKVGDLITGFQTCETSKNMENTLNIIYRISEILKSSNIPFYNSIEDLKEDVNNRYNG